MEVFQQKFDQTLTNSSEIIKSQKIEISGLVVQIDILKMEKIQLKQDKVFTCEECDFEVNNRDTIINHKYTEH